MPDERFSPGERLRKRIDFKRAEKTKVARLVTKHLIIVAAPNECHHTRIGITASAWQGLALGRTIAAREAISS